MIVLNSPMPVHRRPGITLTEILIAILIMGVGLVSLATLFPIGLLRLRDANRYSRSAYLSESAASDLEARGLLTNSSFYFVDQYNLNYSFTAWFTNTSVTPNVSWSPLTQDTAAYLDTNAPVNGVNTSVLSGGYGLPFAYDPLWRSQTVSTVNGTNGYYIGDTYEARFGAGLGFLQNDPDIAGTGVTVPSAHGLQRITNFNRPAIMPAAGNVPTIFVSPEDVVWQDPTVTGYTVAFSQNTNTGNTPTAVGIPSPVLPDLNMLGGSPILDWHYSWMFTGQQNNASAGSTFDGNIVIFENRPFGIDQPASTPNLTGVTSPYQSYQVAGETVVEAVFGYSGNIKSYGGGAPGFGAGADRTVLLRWYSTQSDPVVKVGDWIADVTYERNSNVVAARFNNFPLYVYNTTTGTWVASGATGGLQNPLNNGEWDDLPAQRCYWYRVQKVVPPTVDSAYGSGFRSMVVYVDRSLQARTVLNTGGLPYFLNAALISPYVVNVIPQTIVPR